MNPRRNLSVVGASGGPRFSFIPAAAVHDQALSSSAFKVLCFIGQHTNHGGWCRLKQGRIATDMGYSRSTVQAALKVLYARGWLEKRHEGWEGVAPDQDGQPFAAHSYRVCIEREAPVENIPEEPEKRAEVAGGVPDPQGTGCPTQTRHQVPDITGHPIVNVLPVTSTSPLVVPPAGCEQPRAQGPPRPVRR